MRAETKEEKRAVWGCIFIMVIGIGLGFHNASWVGRAGALVIIVGVLLGFSRLPDIIQARWDALKITAPAVAEGAMAQVEKELGKKLSDKERGESVAKVQAAAEKEMSEGIEAWKKNFRRYELAMVVGGTFINGFGEYFMKVARSLSLDN